MDTGGNSLIADLRLALDVRRKELHVLHQAALLLLSEAAPDAETLNTLVALVPTAFLFPDQVRVRIRVDGDVYGPGDFPRGEPGLAAAFRGLGDGSGCIEAVYTARAGDAAAPDFLPEEQELLESLARLLEAAFRHVDDVSRVREADRRFRALFDNETECVKVLDAERRVVDINPAGVCMLGASDAAGLAAERLDDFIHADDRAEYRRLHAEAMQGRAARGRYRLDTPDGRTRMLETFNVPMRGADGQTLVLSLTHDLTGSLMQERRFRVLLESSPDAMVIVNAHGHIELVNRMACDMFGYARDEMLGQPVEMLLPEHLAGTHLRHRQTYMAQPRLRAMGVGKSLKARARDGREFTVEVALSPVETLDEPLVCATIRDLTGIREFEAALKEMADRVSIAAGKDYIDKLAVFLSSRFGLSIATIGLLDERKENVRTLAVGIDGTLAENFEYSLTGTPCETVIREDTCIYEDGIQELFPEDVWFKENNLRAYAGVRLTDEAGVPFGIISAVSRTPLRNAIGVESFFKLAAARAAAELDRMRKIEAMAASELRYALAESGTADGLWDMDMVTRHVYYSPRVGELLGMPVTALGANAENFWARVHPADVTAVRDARYEHIHHGKPFDVQYRIRHADGSYRWFRSRGKVTRDARGNAVRFTGSLSDISEGKRHQLQLKAENAWLAAFAAGEPLPGLLRLMADGMNELFEDVAATIILGDADDAIHCFPAASPVPLDHANVRLLMRELPATKCRLDSHSAVWPCAPGQRAFDRARLVPVMVEGVRERVLLALFLPPSRRAQEHELRALDSAARLIRLSLENIAKAAELERQRRLFENLFHSAPEAIVILDREDRVLDVNPRFSELFQFDIETVRGEALNSLIVPPEFAREATQLSEQALQGGEVTREGFRRRKDGTLLPVSILGAPVTVEGTPAAYFAIYRDRSSLHEAAQRLDHQARHDQLTGLPNRYEFERRLRQAMQWSQDARASLGVIHFDLDQFKVVNDTVGHARGDELLLDLTRRLRELAGPSSVLARLGGDEFAMLLVNARQADCERLTEQIRENLAAAPFQLENRNFTVSASFGVVVVDAGMPQDPHEILSLADSACFFAKERGRNRVQVYGANDQGVMQRREEMDWISRINDALLDDRFRLYRQRIQPVEGDDAVQHCEILLRMVDRDGNNVPPAVFIPPAERYNLMPRIDRWMLEAVFRRLEEFSRAEQERLLVAVNLSGNTLSDENLSEHVAGLFEKRRVLPAAVCFEITETAAIANFDAAMRFIATARGLGCRVALDDFGSGLSSFRYLKEIKPDYLKIDGSFVREIARSDTDFSVVEAINRVGKIIGIRTVAEFVEDDETLRALRRIGVDLAQGYGLHRPEPWV